MLYLSLVKTWKIIRSGVIKGDYTLETTMETTENQRFIDDEKTFSPAEVRKLLEVDNKEIQRLCKEVSVFPKKDNSTGKIFFFKNDVEVLKKIKYLYQKTQNIEDRKLSDQNTALTLPDCITKPVNTGSDINTFVDAVRNTKEDIVTRLTSVIEEKLEGIDDVVVELIKSKVENERLRMKMDQLTKENYKLIGEIDKFKPVALGLYKKLKD